MSQASYVFILTQSTHRLLYVGVTSNLAKRVWEHRTKVVPGFTAKYNCTKLVYVEQYEDIERAIEREKQLKAGSRENKLRLIEKDNPTFVELYPQLMQ